MSTLPSRATEAGYGEPLRQSLRGLPAGASALTRMLYLECRHFSADHNLNYTDKMSMAAGVEVRVPLLDTELVRLAFSLPDRLKQRGTVGKWVFKEAMTGLLPSVTSFEIRGTSSHDQAWVPDGAHGRS